MPIRKPKDTVVEPKFFADVETSKPKGWCGRVRRAWNEDVQDEIRFPGMNESLSHLMESSVQIAWDYLERSGEVDDAAVASRPNEHLDAAGGRLRLVLSNKAITAYQRFIAQKTLTLV